MSKFTTGNWEYSEYVPNGITLNGKEYLIQADGKDVALARFEADARLMAAAPEMYRLLEDARGIITQMNVGDPLATEIELFLARIDGEEAEHDAD